MANFSQQVFKPLGSYMLDFTVFLCFGINPCIILSRLSGHRPSTVVLGLSNSTPPPHHLPYLPHQDPQNYNISVLTWVTNKKIIWFYQLS